MQRTTDFTKDHAAPHPNCLGSESGVKPDSSLSAAAAFYVLIGRMFIPFEEEKMTRELGEAFLRFRERTRRWL